MASKKAARGGKKSTKAKAKVERVQVSGSALPRETLQEAERIAKIIHDTYAGKTAKWDDLAAGLELAPNNTKTKYLIWSATAYGLIQKVEDGAYALAETGRKIVAPTYDGEDLEARRKAAVTPSLLSKFFSEYDGHPVPDSQHFANVLETRFGVPRDRTEEAAELILAVGTHAGLLTNKDGRQFVGAAEARSKAPIGAGTSEAPDAVERADAPDWKSICFYITPIGEDGSDVRKHADMMLTHLVTTAAADHGLTVVRADKIAKSGLITQQVFEYLIRSRVCVADLSFGNPNAFYELGVRHVCKLTAIQLIRKGDKIPFDVSQGRTITIDTSDVYTVMDKMASAKRELSEHLRAALEDDGASSDNPVHFYLPNLKVSLP